MKTLHSILIFILMISTTFNSSAQNNDSKILVAYYSYSGNTKAVAEQIQKLIARHNLLIAREPNYYRAERACGHKPVAYRLHRYPLIEQPKKHSCAAVIEQRIAYCYQQKHGQHEFVSIRRFLPAAKQYAERRAARQRKRRRCRMRAGQRKPYRRHEIRHAYGRMQRRKVPRAHLRPVFHIIPFRNAFL